MPRRFLLAAVAAAALVAAVASSADASVQSTALRCAEPDDRVSAIVIGNGVAFLGGRFTHVTDKGGTSRARAHLAAIDTRTCDLLPWQADTNGDVEVLTLARNTLFAGGTFSRVGGTPRSNLAAVSTSSGAVTPFNPEPNNAVLALTSVGDTLYAGGEFTKVGASSRSKLAAFSISRGALSSSWTPTAPAHVFALAPAADGSRVYVGGNFTTFNGSSAYPYLAAVSPTNGQTDSSFKPRSTFPINELVIDGRGVYAAGAGSGGHLAIWNLDGTLQQPLYQTDGDVQAVAVRGNSLFAGGHFTNYCVGNTGSGRPYQCDHPTSRRKLFEVNLSSGAVTSWAPSLNKPFGVLASAIDPATGNLWEGGDFTTVNGNRQQHLTVFPT